MSEIERKTAANSREELTGREVLSSTSIRRAVQQNVDVTSDRLAASHDVAAQAVPAPAADPRRLLLVIPFGPRFDNRHGGRVVAQLLARLVERHHVAVVYLAEPHDPPMEPTLASRCAVVERVELPPARWPPAGWRHRIHVLSTPVTVRPSPVAAAFSRHFARAVREIAVAWKPDIIQIERDVLAYCLPFLNGVAPLARILVCHDPGLTASKDLAEMTVRRQKLAHRLDAATWRRYWARTLPAFDAVIAFTDIDIRALRGVSPGLRVFRIPLGIDLPRNPCNPIGAGEPDVLFIGGYAHQPNSDAATRLIRSIMPLARRRVPGLRLTLVGEKPTDEMRRMASADDVITGSVPSVTPYVDEASLVVLPIRVGGGMRVKLLESLAAGKAVVASRLAASGLNATHGRELVLAETDQEFADAIATLLGDEAARSKLAHAAREWACSSLTWESRVHEYERLYGHLLNSHG